MCWLGVVLCNGKGLNVCVNMCVNMCENMCVNMYVNRCVNMCINICINMSVNISGMVCCGDDMDMGCYGMIMGMVWNGMGWYGMV